MPTASPGKTQKMIQRLRLLSQEVLMQQRVMEAIRRGLNRKNLLKLIIQSISQGLGFKRSGIFLVDPDGRHLRLAMGQDKYGRFETKHELIPTDRPLGAGTFYSVLTGRKKYFLSNNVPKRIPGAWKYKVEVYNNAIVPIQVGRGKIIGTVAVDNLFQHKPITQSDIASLMNYATQIGLALESLQAHEKIVNQSLTDPMTGLYNRRYFDQALSMEIKRSQRYERPFSVILVDIDHFKRVNDTYGHPAGDEIIRQISFLLRKNVRHLDVVCRVGGEEFGIILPETPGNHLSTLVKRILLNVRDARPAVNKMAQAKERVTVSLGLASYKRGPVTDQQVFKAADKSLYHAKRHGRNRAGLLQVVGTRT